MEARARPGFVAARQADKGQAHARPYSSGIQQPTTACTRTGGRPLHRQGRRRRFFIIGAIFAAILVGPRSRSASSSLRRSLPTYSTGRLSLKATADNGQDPRGRTSPASYAATAA